MRDLEKKIKSKIKLKKEEKKQKLFSSAYKLFTTKGIKNTSIQDIVDSAEVAKGTFYLYFKDKYDIEEKLIIQKSCQLFNEALKNLENNYIENFDDEIIYVINYVIDELVKDNTLINFISKDLSLGVYNDKLARLMDNNEIGLYDVFINSVREKNIELENPDVTLFMIIELVSSTCFTAITKNIPLSINEYKPYLYSTIRKMLHN